MSFFDNFIDQKSVNEIFSSVASKYDLMNDLMSLGLHRLWKQKFVKLVLDEIKFKLLTLDSSEQPYISLVDVACGSCDISLQILKEFDKIRDNLNAKNISISCVDINKEMLRKGKEELINSGFFDANLVLSDANNLPFEDNSFDFYTITFGVRNIKSQDMGLNESYRILKKNGIFFCMEFGRPDFWLSKTYKYYSKTLIPALGELIAKNKEAYEYLVESIEQFPAPNGFLFMMQEAGFTETKVIKLQSGIVNIYIGTK